MEITHNSQEAIYRTPFGAVPAGRKVTLRLALEGAGAVDRIWVCLRTEETEYNVGMAYVFTVGSMHFYEAEIKTPAAPGLLWYYFGAVISEKTVYYGNNPEGLGGLGQKMDTVPRNFYQITVYAPDYTTPAWFRESVVYQIFPDRFYSAGEALDGGRRDFIRRAWGETPYYQAEQFGGEYLANDFFGGNLRGIREKLPYLAELGITCLYLNPIFKAFSNHKYDTGDYLEVDPMFGTEADFQALCAAGERLGIRVILDGVFNHTGSDSRYFNQAGNYEDVGAYQSQESPYYTWYDFIRWPEEYAAWWGMKSLPQVNETSESFQRFILTGPDAVVKKWLRAGASGWRLDVVDELPDFFVKLLRREVKREKPEAVIIGEVWEDASNKCSYGKRREYFLGAELDSVMNYPLRQAIIDFACGRIDGLGFSHRVTSLQENYPPPAFYALLNILSSHDVERILTAVSDPPALRRAEQADYRIPPEQLPQAADRAKSAVMLQMLWPGVPCVYYGDEAGMQGFADPFCRGTFPWEAIDEDFYQWHKQLIALRKSSPAFTAGSFEQVYVYGRGYGFIRIAGPEKYIVLVNFSGDQQCFRIDAARFGIRGMENALWAQEQYGADNGIFYVDMPPGWAKVFRGK